MKKQEIIVLGVVCLLGVFAIGGLAIAFFNGSSKRNDVEVAANSLASQQTNSQAQIENEAVPGKAALSEPTIVEAAPVEEAAPIEAPIPLVKPEAGKELVEPSNDDPFGMAPIEEPELSSDTNEVVKPKVVDWRKWSFEKRLEYCENAAKAIGDDDISAGELIWEMQLAIGEKSDELDDQEISDLFAMASVLMPTVPLGSFDGVGPDQTGKFVVGVRRFVPIVWNSDPDGFLSFSLHNAKTGKIVAANVVTTVSGDRMLWIDQGIYYLDVNATGQWSINFFRSKAQLQRFAEAAKKILEAG